MAPHGEHGLPVEGEFTLWILVAGHVRRVSADRTTEQEDLRRDVPEYRGSRTSARVPRPGRETTLIRPPADSIRTRCEASPMCPSASRSPSRSGSRPVPSSSTTSSTSSPAGRSVTEITPRLRMPDDVGDELANRREEQLIVAAGGSRLDIEPELDAGALGGTRRDRAHGGVQPASSRTYG